MSAQGLAHGCRRRHGALDLPLRIRRHFIGCAIIRRIDHRQRQVAGAVEVGRDDA